MRNHGRLFVVSSAVIGVGILGLANISHADTEVGRIAVVNGEVKVGSSESDPKARLAKPNDVIHNQDVIKTGDGAAAKILFSDQTVMDLGPSSAMKVSDYAIKDVESRTGTFSILYGKLRALVTKKVGPNGKLEVKTGDAVMGVRGTEFLVDSPKGANAAGTQLVVVSGVVQCRPPAGGPPITVGAGQMVMASPKTFAAAAGAGGASTASSGADAKSESKSESTKSDSKADAKGDAKSDAKAGDAGKSSAASATANAGTGTATASGDTAGGGVVMKVSAEQMQTMVSGAKAQDNTFMGSVTIASSTGGGTSSTAMTNVGNLIASVALPPPPSESGTTKMAPPPVNVPNFLPPVNLVPGNQVHLSVTVQ